MTDSTIIDRMPGAPVPLSGPVTRVLVANRGEIARRVFHTCRALGIGTVAVHSTPDADAPFVREADRAVHLPGARAADTYLRADLLIDAARRAGADAIHPGYGFLSENADFARAVVDAGLRWIGPSPNAIRAMGSKVESKRLMAAAGVPVLDALDPRGITAADLPVIVKASAGGGGRGMRVVRDLADLTSELAAAGAEAASAFGDPTVFCEPYLETGHHVEVQVMADRHGTVWAVGERECSIQRRHQKVVEEAPSPLVERTPGMRERLFAAAVAAARAVDYEGAGTVEFLADELGRFFFLEMNTRLQVEHPVTECTTGLDLVALQLRVAAGEALPAAPPTPSGAAIEVRLYAEDPAQDWQPQAGTLREFAFSATDPAFDVPLLAPSTRGIRVDSAVERGSVVGVHYDPMLAKVIAWAPTRGEAARSLARALTGARIHGLRTNRDLLVRVLQHPAFLAGETDTAFLPTHGLAALAAPLVGPEDERLAALVAALAGSARRRASATVQAGLPSGWRNLPSAPQTTTLRGPAGEHEVRYRLTRGGLDTAYDGVELVRLAPGEVALSVEGVVRTWQVSHYATREGDAVVVDGPDGSVAFAEVDRFPDPRSDVAPGSLVAPMPGTVASVQVAAGDAVAPGQPLIVLEAMKMLHTIAAPAAGTVAELPVAAGDTVDLGSVLVVIDHRSDPATPEETA